MKVGEFSRFSWCIMVHQFPQGGAVRLEARHLAATTRGLGQAFAFCINGAEGG
jgi:hypothetical protein